MGEVVQLRQEQQNTRARIHTMVNRLQGTEEKHQQIMAFLARAMQDPNFFQQLAEFKDRRKELQETISMKRRRLINQGPVHGDGETRQSLNLENQFEVEGQPLLDSYVDEASELESLALEIQGPEMMSTDNEQEKQESGYGELNDDLWELFDGGSGGKGGLEMEERDDGDVNVLVERLGCPSSGSNSTE